jgi:hypothetical protein
MQRSEVSLFDLTAVLQTDGGSTERKLGCSKRLQTAV